jgi:hypothetical protein
MQHLSEARVVPLIVVYAIVRHAREKASGILDELQAAPTKYQQKSQNLGEPTDYHLQ